MPSAAVRHPLFFRRNWLAAGVLAGIAFAAFAPAIGYGFVSYDDPFYVTNTPQVTQGLSAGNVAWAFTTFRVANWHPLTWMSLQLDASVWGKSAWGFHLTNVLLHAANAALLFLVLQALTGAFWPAVVTAALFAVHPLRAESVAWVSERKDVLSIFFGLLALLAYTRYARRPAVTSYLAMSIAFVCSLLSKPTLVTLPCLMLVLDWWPLRRTQGGGAGPGEVSQPQRSANAVWLRLVAEKLPLLAVVVIASLVTNKAQESRGARRDLDEFPLRSRVENAAVAYVAYLSKTAWPTGLAVFYPHSSYPGGKQLSPAEVAASALLLGALTAGCVALRRRAPYLLMGWLWYLGTLVPTIGLVQVGSQAYADRYSYFPQIGILVALCWGVADLARGWPRTTLAAGAAATLALLAVTEANLPVWKDSFALWDNALRTTGENAMTLVSLGQVMEERREKHKAANYYRAAIDINPNAVLAYVCLGALLSQQNKLDDSVRELEKARELAPGFPMVRNNLGKVYYSLRRLDDAALEYEQAIQLAPEYDEVYFNLASVEMERGQLDRAVELYREAARRSPHSAEVQLGFGVALMRLGRTEEGLTHLRESVRLEPKSVQGNYNLGAALLKRGDPKQDDLEGAAQCFQRVIDLKPPSPLLERTLENLGEAIRRLGRPRTAGEFHR